MQLTKDEKHQVDFPFYKYKGMCDEYYWAAGCHQHVIEGPEIYEGQTHDSYDYTADALGKVAFEVIEIVKLDGRRKDRVLYTKQYTDPDGKVGRKSELLMKTVDGFLKLLERPIKVDYEVEND